MTSFLPGLTAWTPLQADLVALYSACEAMLAIAESPGAATPETREAAAALFARLTLFEHGSRLRLRVAPWWRHRSPQRPPPAARLGGRACSPHQEGAAPSLSEAVAAPR